MKKIVSTLVFCALTASATCAPALADKALMHPASLNAKAPATFHVDFKTTAGNFTVAVTRAWSPHGADRFYNLVKHGFYDGNEFFRVVPGFVVQFGLSANPAVTAVWSASTAIPDDPVKQSNLMGYVVFADSGPNTRTTQLFINLANNPNLDGMGFSPFGMVTSGLGVVQKIYSGYGEQPDQGQITSAGNAYLRTSFPRLDRIISARIH